MGAPSSTPPCHAMKLRGEDGAPVRAIGYSVGWRNYEPNSFRPSCPRHSCPAEGAGRAATGWRRPAVYRGVLLQAAMGPSAGVSATVPEEPLPAAAED